MRRTSPSERPRPARYSSSDSCGQRSTVTLCASKPRRRCRSTFTRSGARSARRSRSGGQRTARDAPGLALRSASACPVRDAYDRDAHDPRRGAAIATARGRSPRRQKGRELSWAETFRPRWPGVRRAPRTATTRLHSRLWAPAAGLEPATRRLTDGGKISQYQSFPHVDEGPHFDGGTHDPACFAGCQNEASGIDTEIRAEHTEGKTGPEPGPCSQVVAAIRAAIKVAVDAGDYERAAALLEIATGTGARARSARRPPEEP